MARVIRLPGSGDGDNEVTKEAMGCAYLILGGFGCLVMWLAFLLSTALVIEGWLWLH